MQRFVDATLEGWAQYLKGGPAIEAANALIKKHNPEQTDDRIAYAIKVLNERGIVMSGDALNDGIGAMSDRALEEFLRLDGRGRRGAQGAGRRPRLYAGIREQGHWKGIGERHVQGERRTSDAARSGEEVRAQRADAAREEHPRPLRRGPAGGAHRRGERKLFKQCKELGLWALDVPEEAGGANLPAVALVGVNEELGYTCVPFTFPPDSPNLHMMLATVKPEQRKKYLEPYAAGRDQSRPSPSPSPARAAIPPA